MTCSASANTSTPRANTGPLAPWWAAHISRRHPRDRLAACMGRWTVGTFYLSHRSTPPVPKSTACGRGSPGDI
jgi:hypothetical protein